MVKHFKKNNLLLLLIVGLSSWLLPGAGYFLIKEKRRAIIAFTAITLTFCTGLYIGSIGVVDPVGAKLWYSTQIMCSPLIAVLGYFTAGGGYPVYARPNEIGQIYTSIAGLLNLLCIVNSTYMAHLQSKQTSGE